MAQYQNLTGTTSKTFKIGKFGTTLSIGTVNLYDTSIQYLQSDTALLTNKVLLDATGNTYIDSSNYTGNANIGCVTNFFRSKIPRLFRSQQVRALHLCG